MDRPSQQVTKQDPTPRQVLQALLHELPSEISSIELLEIRQATPNLYSVRVTQTYRGEPTGFMVGVGGQSG